MLEFTHNPWMVAASFAVALFAGFSGLSLLRGASRLPVVQRKFLVAVAAIVLGGGIWSMHFVAMLGLQLPTLFFYDGLITLMSALVAILMVGLALLVLHFGRRTPISITAAGSIMGAGIAAMHYIGMLGMELCGPVFRPLGVVVALAAALALSNLAVWVAYGSRTRGNILLGTLCFAAAVVSMHFIAMAGTQFYRADVASTAGPVLSNAVLAMLVTVSSFVISGVSLLSGVSFFGSAAVTDTAMNTPGDAPGPDVAAAGSSADPAGPPKETRSTALPVPYERDGNTRFAESSKIAAVRAEGHYTVLYTGKDKYLCPWSISEAYSRLGPYRFIRVHRSYLINPAYVSEFRRTKDTGVCFFKNTESLAKAPVSRSRLADVRAALGI
ncbi:carbon monoxide dehydrogenase [Antarcticimicrobium luteum]|uniref:Carbon monoxide dehydrogenase n=1 Tax=Antarcticimicrobium luteum TaxID=2547397 RepID=A0A4R5UR75_9RHOB|nr:carbon monoxide dehydrogenase [Antarcticimicrobium luteum]